MKNDLEQIQKQKDGYGALYHRVYSIRVKASSKHMQSAMRKLQADPNRFSPQSLARFEKLSGAPDTLANGDKFQIHITGPWNGPVVVSSLNPLEFRLETLTGHMEAGEIYFRLKLQTPSHLIFEIESIARSRDAFVDLAYDKIGLAKAAQTEMWVVFCENFAKIAMGKDVSEDLQGTKVEILTERRDEETGEWIRI